MSGSLALEDFAPLGAGAEALGVPLDATQLDRLARYRTLLLEWNARFNLTAITDPAEIVTRHFLDALTCIAALPRAVWEGDALLLDVGSGAGFPGLPLAIALPRWRVTLLEATAKKVRFLETVIAQLGLRNAQALAGRADEVVRRPGQRAHYDVVVARALAALPVLLEYCCPYARIGADILAPKKGDLAAEVAVGRRAAVALGARLLDPVPVRVPPLGDGRVILVARQEHACPDRFPRARGALRNRPLGA